MSLTNKPSDSQSSPGGRSHLAAGAILSGDLTVPGHMELHGHIDGKITADSILIDKAGSTTGELHADSVAIKGSFEGIINAGDVKLHSGAKVSGEVFYQTLSIDSGAEVNSSFTRQMAREA
jgi:cytoskeletal protein CcmA (bactofilin family)